MIVVKFDMMKHFEIILGWLRERECYQPTKDEMPEIGYIVYSENTPISAGFLRKVEGNFAQIDGLVTNPKADSKERDKANDIITTKLLLKAKFLGIKSVTAYSTDKNTIERAVKFDFGILSHCILVKNLID